ncbi:hypothetical protein Alsa1_CDS0139 [Staphylococcus phage Alsa_1]|nr:hypothetical protein Alsa1_CDS0139 [Staphylococcus phage Alsa_1]WNM56190.1 hypothetical protein CoNPh38_CDS0314 [Staphylococcus phage S-CoN_Ph38]
MEDIKFLDSRTVRKVDHREHGEFFLIRKYMEKRTYDSVVEYTVAIIKEYHEDSSFDCPYDEITQIVKVFDTFEKADKYLMEDKI